MCGHFSDITVYGNVLRVGDRKPGLDPCSEEVSSSVECSSCSWSSLSFQLSPSTPQYKLALFAILFPHTLACAASSTLLLHLHSQVLFKLYSIVKVKVKSESYPSSCSGSSLVLPLLGPSWTRGPFVGCSISPAPSHVSAMPVKSSVSGATPHTTPPFGLLLLQLGQPSPAPAPRSNPPS